MWSVVNTLLVQCLVRDVDPLLYLPSHVVLIGQSVFHYSLLLSICLLLASNHRLLSVSCLKTWGLTLTMSIVMSYTDWGHLNILRRGYKRPWLGKAPRQRVAARNSTILTNASDVQGLQEKGVVFQVGWVHRQNFRF